jgi:hypothetical protein
MIYHFANQTQGMARHWALASGVSHLFVWIARQAAGALH